MFEHINKLSGIRQSSPRLDKILPTFQIPLFESSSLCMTATKAIQNCPKPIPRSERHSARKNSRLTLSPSTSPAALNTASLSETKIPSRTFSPSFQASKFWRTFFLGRLWENGTEERSCDGSKVNSKVITSTLQETSTVCLKFEFAIRSE